MRRFLIGAIAAGVVVCSAGWEVAGRGGKSKGPRSLGQVELYIRSRPDAGIFLDGRYMGYGSLLLNISCDPFSGRYLGIKDIPEDGGGILELVLGSEKASYVLAKKELGQNCSTRSYRRNRLVMIFDFRKGRLSESSDVTGRGATVALSYGNPRLRASVSSSLD